MNPEYQEYLKVQHEQWEAQCGHCGACCGRWDDPCKKLISLKNGSFICQDYKNRLGWQETVSGKKFKCVEIREILHLSWMGDECCGYKKRE